jgi:phosphomannomutase/phosphoglucomutase
MRTGGADIGIAHDGDADRVAFVTGGGDYVSGDKTLALLSRSELKKKAGTVVTPVATSRMVEDVVKKEGGKLTYTAVGSPVVARKMMAVNAVFGGEENGGMIFPDMQYCRDGPLTVAKMLESIVRYGPLAQQIATLPVYHTYKFKINCPDGRKQMLLKLLSEGSKGDSKDETDGLKIMFKDGWVLMRPSGTEPIFRIYSESKNDATAKKRGKEFVAAAEKYLKIVETPKKPRGSP